MKYLRHPLGAAVAALCLAVGARAQLQWNVYNETTTVPAPASTAANGVVVTVPAGQRVTLVASNFVPVDLTAAGSVNLTTINFKVSGGLSTISSGTRAIGFGLFNNGGTATNYSDDGGYFTWLNGRATGSLVEQHRRFGDGTSPSLLNPTGTAVGSESTGSNPLIPGTLSDGNNYAIQLQLQGKSGSVSFGSTSSNTAGAGVWVSGPGISQTTFSNPDTPAAAFVFNEIGFMFLNTTTSDVQLTINSVTGLTPINPPAIATQPASISVNPGQAGALTVVTTGTPPLTYQWNKDGTNVAGATSATYPIASAATTDGGSYTVTITNAYGTVTSSAAVVTVTTSTIPATITNQPVGATANVGDNVSFSVAAFGSAPISYQWRKDGTAITGATGTTLSLSSVTGASAGSYTVVVTAGTSTATSNAAVLSVNTAPAITTQPANVTASVGQNVSFSVVATGSPAPIYQWSRNGVPIVGATSASISLNNITLANAGNYTVAITNSVGAVTSATGVLAIPSTMSVAALAPANGATGVNADTPLRITFDRAPVIGTTGRIRIFKAADDTVADTLDLGSTLQQRTVGTNSTLYNFFPVAVTGNTALLYVHAGVLAYGQTYYVQLEQSTFLDSTGASFTGIIDKTTWRFTTKAAGPAANANAITVAADGSGDFTTVQGAIDFVPLNNTQRVVITVRKGTYNELTYIGATRPLITIHGEDRTLTVITYADNNNLNSTTATRAAMSLAGNDTVLENLTVLNPTPQGGSQAEAVFTGAQRVLLNRVNLLSRQDTLLTNTGTAFITDSYIEGNVDFMWGTAAAYFQRCELKALDVGTATQGFYTQVRNTAENFGNVYVDCKLTAAPGVAGTVAYYLGRIDPTAGNFPYSQCMYLNCAMGPHIDPAGWLLGTSNNVTSTTVQYWEYKSTDLNGGAIDVTKRISSSRQLSDSEAALWRNPAFVLGGWIPQIGTSIEAPLASQTATVGSTARLTVVANGAPEPALQWFKNGVAIAGATSATLALPNVQLSDAGSYTVNATNAGGSVTSSAATLTVVRGPFVGTYFGTVGTAGSFALYVRDSGSGVFLGVNGTTTLNSPVTVDASGKFAFTAAGNVAVAGTISGAGAVSGTVGTAAIAGTRSAATGVSQAYAGYYLTGANGASSITSLIVGSTGQAFAFVQTSTAADAGTGTVDGTGKVSVTTAGSIPVTATVAADGSSASATFTPSGATAITTAGVADTGAANQRMREFSARVNVTPTGTAAAGFVITGDTPETVLIRGIGPTLTDAFSVSGALVNPRLDLYRAGTVIASNTGWYNAANASEAALNAVRVGTFPLRTAFADSAISITLAPGAYSAVLSSASGTTSGIGLLEVYDVGLGSLGQRLVNLSVAGVTTTGATSLTAGVVVSGLQPKRMLIRAAGPALANFGVASALAKPSLVLTSGTTVVGRNTGWGTSPDAAGIAAAAGSVGAFAFPTGSADSAILVNLAPGVYSAQVVGADGASGFTLIEIYEVP